MKKITEDYVNFEISRLLKEKGFDWDCESKRFYPEPDYDQESPNGVYAPTLQTAMKWLREVHHYYIQVMLDSWACGGHLGYYVVIQKTDSDFEMMLQDAVDEVFYQTYDEACEAAIKCCLENLI